MPATSGSWTVNSMEGLSLFNQVDLNARQLNALPSRIRDQIFKGYSDVLNSPRMAGIEPSSSRISFSANTLEGGEIQVSYDGGRRYYPAGNLADFPQLLRALHQTREKARTMFPTAFHEKSPAAQIANLPAPKPGSSIGRWRGEFLDGNSMLRNGLKAAGKNPTFVAYSGETAGVIGLWGATEIGINAKAAYDRAVHLGDEEGMTKASCDGVIGASWALSSLGQYFAFLPSAIGDPSMYTSKAMDGIDYGANASVVAMSLALMVSARHEWNYVTEFRRDLKEILERDVSSQKKAIEAIEFFQQQIGLTDMDMAQLHESCSDEAALHEAIGKKVLEKYDRFVRRVGAKVAEKMMRDSERLILKLKEGNADALAEAKELIEMADQESFNKKVKCATLALIGMLQISAVVLGYVFLGDAVIPAIIYAINAGVWMTIDSNDLHGLIGNGFHWFFKPSDGKRWANSIEQDASFRDKILTAFRKEGRWDLAKLKNIVEQDIGRMIFILNGKSVENFEMIQEELGLKEVDFESKCWEEAELTEKQKKALEFLAMLHPGIMAKLMKEFPRGSELLDGQKTRFTLDAHFNLKTSVGTICARKPFDLKNNAEDLDGIRVVAQVELEGDRTSLWIGPSTRHIA